MNKLVFSILFAAIVFMFTSCSNPAMPVDTKATDTGAKTDKGDSKYPGVTVETQDLTETTEEQQHKGESTGGGSSERPLWAQGEEWDHVDWESFEWWKMTLRQILEYIEEYIREHEWDED